MKCWMKLRRPYDRNPGDHKYGQPFDEQLDLFIGGSANWEKLADAPDGPVAEVSNPKVRVELHETGPEFTFFIVHASEIATYLGALATLISTWVSVRRAYRKPRDPVWEPDGTIIEFGDLKITAGRDLTPEEIQSLAKSMLDHARETTGDDTDGTKDDAYPAAAERRLTCGSLAVGFGLCRRSLGELAENIWFLCAKNPLRRVRITR